MKKKSKHAYGKGWSGGYGEYRYGCKRPVYDPSKPPVEPIIKDKEAVAKTADLLADWKVNRWENESAVRKGLRDGLIVQGHGYEVSDLTAYEIIRRAFNKLGRGVETRPTVEQGQAEYTIPRESCSWCGSPLDDHDILMGLRFCCAEHARLAKDRREYAEGWYRSELGKAAYRMLYREKNETRLCAWEGCRLSFKPSDPNSDQRYCCPEHAYAAMRVTYEERLCEYSGEPFIPSYSGQRYATQANATAALRKNNEKVCAREGCDETFKPKHGEDTERDKYCSRDCADIARATPKHWRECQWCGDPFLAKTKVARFCCDAHYLAHKRATRGILPARITAPAFDFVFA